MISQQGSHKNNWSQQGDSRLLAISKGNLCSLNCPYNPKICFSLKWIYAHVQNALRPFFLLLNKSCHFIHFKTFQKNQSSFFPTESEGEWVYYWFGITNWFVKWIVTSNQGEGSQNRNWRIPLLLFSLKNKYNYLSLIIIKSFYNNLSFDLTMLATTVHYLHVHVCMPYLLLCAFSGKEIEQFPERKREKHGLNWN